MGIRDLFRRSSAEVAPNRGGMVSPWSEGDALSSFVWQDVFGGEDAPVSRGMAMRLPAVAAPRARILETLAGRPLVAYDITDQPLTEQDAWLSSIDAPWLPEPISPYERMARTLDDLMFYGWSLWAVARAGERITTALHVPFERWHTSPDDSTIYVDDEAANPAEVILIPGPFAGLLVDAADTIRGGLDIERSWRAKARNPIPTAIFEEISDGAVDPKVARQYVQDYAKARRNPEGAVTFVPAVMKLRFEGEVNPDLMMAARNSVRLDIAAFLNVSASGVDAATNQSTLRYETDTTVTQQLTDRMSFWTEPIEARLSLDDVTPPGTRIRFDFTDRNTATTGTPTED
ncbi:MAG: hypothetical protein ACTH9T_04855 [Mycetocola reblochoni]|uniref:hypothetical protein n=1 Tax=Mycetocola reblochoni TaxID=331618 RepID=UPI003F9629F3